MNRICLRFAPTVLFNLILTLRTLCLAMAVANVIAIPVAQAQAVEENPTDWRPIIVDAQRVVSRESPLSTFPFQTATAGRGKALVIAHYFPVFPLSYDGLPSAQDYYATQFLRAGGENGKHAKQGGFLRERPLNAPFLSPQPYFRHANLAVEIARAARIGIDGFGVNLLSLSDTDFMPAARKLLDAAAASRSAFKIFPEPDMSVLRGLSPSTLADALMVFAKHPAALRRDGALFVMPLAAESYTPRFWKQVKTEMRRRGHPIVLMPCYYDPAAASMAKLRDVSWGVTFWGTRGPTAGDIASGVIDLAMKIGFSRWMIPVSPQDARPKDLLAFESGNSQGYRNQWDTAIARSAKMVQIVTWNDYSETSEVSPSSFSRFVFYDLTAYYIAWLKAGRAPVVTRDAFYFVQRNQIFRPDTSLQGARWSRTGNAAWSNDIEVVALLTKPGELVLRSGSALVRKSAHAGLQTISITAQPGRASVILRRGGRAVSRFTSPISIEQYPQRHDPTYGGVSSPRSADLLGK